MNTLTRVRKEVQWQDFKVLTSEADQVLQISKDNNWTECRLFAYGEMIDKHTSLDGWELFPADEYQEAIPEEGIRRVHKLINSGVRIKGLVVADDGSRKAPETANHGVQVNAQPRIDLLKIGAVVASVIGVFALVIAGLFVAVILAAIVAAVAFPVLFMGAFAGVMIYDPLLIIVLESGDWIVCYEWDH